MPNSLFGKLGNNQPPKGNNMMALMQSFNQFNQNFHGDAKQQVQGLLNSGQMKQEDLDKIIPMAKSFQSFIGMFKR